MMAMRNFYTTIVFMRLLLPTQFPEEPLKVAGMAKKLFEESALTAIYQGAGGLLRKSNSLARGGLIAAAIENKDFVNSEQATC